VPFKRPALPAPHAPDATVGEIAIRELPGWCAEHLS